ncbi:MAG TPA: hypothetical protein VFB73_14595 [Chloroflexota bacterium]|nr:hypothetical protein [Chloroflexota bacterium]
MTASLVPGSRALLLVVGLVLLVGARPAGDCESPVPVFPGAQPAGGVGPGEAVAGLSTTGQTTWATEASLLDIQQFYFIRLTGAGWTPVAQLPGQHPDAFARAGRINQPEPVLEFTRDGARVRITNVGGGYSVELECP